MTVQDIPAELAALRCYWVGVDDDVPGCTQYVTKADDVVVTYLVRDGQIIGRVELRDGYQYAYVGGGLDGGTRVGSDVGAGVARLYAGAFADLAYEIVQHADR